MRRNILTVSMVVLLILLGYMIFNLENPNGLQRYVISDPADDLWLLIGLGFSVFVLTLLLMRDNDRHRGGR